LSWTGKLGCGEVRGELFREASLKIIICKGGGGRWERDAKTYGNGNLPRTWFEMM